MWIKEKQREHRKNNPWINSYFNAKQRCENPNNPNYPWWGAKGIKFYLTMEEIKELWFKYKADKMKFPTIDRKDNKGNYTVDNCQFIENIKNSLKDRNHPKIAQYSLDGKLIRVCVSQSKIARKLGLSQGDISHCVNGTKLKTVGGYIWKKYYE